jgi:hypothetical protein
VAFVEVAPLYFRQVDGQFHLLFREDDLGRITHMVTDVTPQFAFDKLKWYETPAFNMALVLGCVLVFLSMIAVVLIRFIRNRRQSAYRKPASRGARVGYRIIVGICVLNLLFVTGTVLWGYQSNVLLGTSMNYKIVLGVGVLGAVLTVGALLYSVLAWKNSYWSIANRVHYTLVTVAAVAFVWFLNYWNLLGWRF